MIRRRFSSLYRSISLFFPHPPSLHANLSPELYNLWSLVDYTWSLEVICIGHICKWSLVDYTWSLVDYTESLGHLIVTVKSNLCTMLWKFQVGDTGTTTYLPYAWDWSNGIRCKDKRCRNYTNYCNNQYTDHLLRHLLSATNIRIGMCSQRSHSQPYLIFEHSP